MELEQDAFLENLMSLDRPSELGYLKRALTDSNEVLSVIIGTDPPEACDIFSSDFHADQSGC